VIILDWTNAVKSIESDIRDDISAAKAAGEPPPNFNLERESRLIEFVQQPIEFNGETYYGHYGWGSAVKRLQTIGLTVDILADAELTEIAEDASRYLRALLPSSLYGGGFLSRCKVLVVPDRTVYKGRMLADGMGLIRRGLFEELRDKDAIPIRLGKGRQNYLQWQRFPWDKIRKVATKLILENLKTVGTLNWVFTKLDSEAGGFKNRLIEADEEMIRHPYLKLSGNISVKKLLQELATTVPLPTFVRIAIPTRCDSVVWEGDEKILNSRHPMDSWQSQAALAVDTKNPYFEAELAYVMSAEIVQTTETSPTTSAKGIRVITDDDVMDGYDLIVTEEDFKLIAGKRVTSFRSGKMKSLVIEDMVIAFTQWYQAGCAAGINPEVWKTQGGDFDGDMAFISPCSEYPVIWDTAHEWLDKDKSFKIPKSRSPLSERPKMLVASFGNNVGFATNVVSTTFVVQPDNRQAIADDMFAGGIIPQPTVKWLDTWCNKVIKVMTDGFKSLVNMLAESATLRKAQQVIASNNGGTASWAVWSQDTSPAFTNIVPLFYDQLPEETLRWIASDKDNRRQPAIKLHIPPQQYSGTCAQIYRLVQPWILEQYQETIEFEGEKYTFLELLDVNPGSKYIGWAPHVSDVLLNQGLDMVREFNGLSRMVDWSSSEDTMAFKETWQEMCDTWSVLFSSRQEAVYTLWRAAHHATIGGSGAASIFMGFPEEALDIVVNKPGLLEQQHEGVVSLLVGVDYNFVGGLAPDVIGPVTVHVYDIDWRGHLRMAVMLDEPLPSMKESDRFPDGMIGMCAQELRNSGEFYTHPEEGSYVARIERNKSGKSFRAYLTPLDD
jgi:hypothetical protein